MSCTTWNQSRIYPALQDPFSRKESEKIVRARGNVPLPKMAQRAKGGKLR